MGDTYRPPVIIHPLTGREMPTPKIDPEKGEVTPGFVLTIGEEGTLRVVAFPDNETTPESETIDMGYSRGTRTW